MKKEQKRYLLVEYAGTQQRIYETKAKLDAALKAIRKSNRQKEAKYICGNISYEEFEGKWYFNAHIYRKLSQRNTISDIDNFTRQFSKSELQAFFAPDSVAVIEGYEPDINIAYFETDNYDPTNQEPIYVGIKYVPVLYREDVKYLAEGNIKQALLDYEAKGDTGFFKDLSLRFAGFHNVKELLIKLNEQIAHAEGDGILEESLSRIAYKVYRRLVDERKDNGRYVMDDEGYIQLSARRKRDFAFFLKYYDSGQPNSPFKYNGSTTKMRKQDLINERDRILAQNGAKEASLKLE